MHQYNDIAIPIAWPDQTARGDELWMAILKKLGVVKNLNFKVGHAAIVLIERKTGNLRYFDFGRYISPRGFGRARSSMFDPRLELETKAKFNEDNSLQNFEEILKELQIKECATHGGGRLLCSICRGISFYKAVEFAEELVEKGPILYGALAPNNNSCSRYVAQILVNSLQKSDKRINKILFPESLKASPTSNVVNANEENEVYCFKDSKLEKWKMGRWDSLKFQINLLHPNFFKSKSHQLPDDLFLGFIDEPNRPKNLPENAQWLGGLGEGCWFSIDCFNEETEITRYNHQGEIDYSVISYSDESFNKLNDFKFSYQVHQNQHVVKQNNKEIIFKTLNINNLNYKKSI